MQIGTGFFTSLRCGGRNHRPSGSEKDTAADDGCHIRCGVSVLYDAVGQNIRKIAKPWFFIFRRCNHDFFLFGVYTEREIIIRSENLTRDAETVGDGAVQSACEPAAALVGRYYFRFAFYPWRSPMQRRLSVLQIERKAKIPWS